MAKMIPAHIHSKTPSPGEHEIFRRLKEEPETRDWIVLHSLDIAHHIKQVSGEIDFLVIIPHKGVLCVEVKACHQLVRQDGLWYYGSNPKSDPRGPFKQVSAAMHSLRVKLAECQPDLAGVVFWSAVVFPYLTFKIPSEEWHPWQVIDNQTFRLEPLGKQLEKVLDHARDFLHKIPRCQWFNPDKLQPSPAQCEEIAQTLRPDFEYIEDHQTKMTRIASEIKYYTEEQQLALDAMEANPRVVFSGPAGTGKTILALEAATRSAEQGNKVLLLCFNRLLGRWLQEQISQLQHQVTTSTLHRYMLEVAGVNVEDYLGIGQVFWEESLPQLAMNRLTVGGDEYLFDEVIIDEAQDILRHPYLQFINLTLKGGFQSGKWRIFGDFEKQAIYGTAETTFQDLIKSWAGEVPIYSLRMNCRNTPRIASIAQRVGELSPGYSKILRPDDILNPEIRFYSNNQSQRQLLLRTIDQLEWEGYARSDIVILSSKASGSCAEVISNERLQPCETARQHQIKYCSIHAYKGLESPVVIVTDIEQISEIIASNLMYVAVTRSIYRLIILSHNRLKKELELALKDLPIEFIDFVGGDEVGQHITNREKIIKDLEEELVGPSPQGEKIDCSQDICFTNMEESYKPRRQKDGQEILINVRPTARYGVGVLYPIPSQRKSTDKEADSLDDCSSEHEMIELGIPKDQEKDVAIDEDLQEKINEMQSKESMSEPEIDDFEISSANMKEPSSMGVSFLATFPNGSKLVVEASGGVYKKKIIKLENNEVESEEESKTRTWWLRNPLAFSAEFPAEKLFEEKRLDPILWESSETRLSIEVFSRPHHAYEDARLLTVCLVNRSKKKYEETQRDELCIFQSRFTVKILSKEGKELHNILPYPKVIKRDISFDPFNEEESLALLYRKAETFAVGHGCAANWDNHPDDGKVSFVSAECFPVSETPSITADIKREDGTDIKIEMAPLAGLVPGDDGFEALEEVVRLYKEWIGKQRDKEIPKLPPDFHRAANIHMEECEKVARRMEQGLEFLKDKDNENARLAFQLANYAILLQQSINKNKRIAFFNKNGKWEFDPPYLKPDPLEPLPNQGKWRAFQIAFLLMSLQSVADGSLPEREEVELIWFPTGGGKTEAYLGLAAFYIFLRRLTQKEDIGVHVIMRYTLRLLTTQQFQRAARMICAMEVIRKDKKYLDKLGEEEFSIGLWLGGDTTPNSREDAKENLKKLNNSKNAYAENKFILDRCPWCGAQMGRSEKDLPSKTKNRTNRVLGYVEKEQSVMFKCPDQMCIEFRDGIPVYVIDKDIYEKRPTIIIGTVDKFATLAWKPEARSIFGINSDGNREYSPPGLIIQDELHLISGPLGSMVGLFEPVIEELCTDNRGEKPIVPKIICSTATIRRYREQVRALYGRKNVTLFPPPGLDAGDSFFACYAQDGSGKLLPGKKYVGVFAPGLRSMQTAQVRTVVSLVQSPKNFCKSERDPWWTLLLFFNSLRELGTTLTLLQTYVPTYMKELYNRTKQDMRRISTPLELTSRLRGDEIPKAIAKLETPCNSSEYPVDVCLASNIIEVGVDIDRLSLMAVVGQPKTTSQYIQVTGRVGRNWRERPGLVITLYSVAKPRDRSHFEKFRCYHERLYAQVEPTSVTPFSPPALDRSLHAALVAYVRQLADKKLTKEPHPFPSEKLEQFKELILKRVSIVDRDELENTNKVYQKRYNQWLELLPPSWTKQQQDIVPLIRSAGSHATGDIKEHSWETQNSMRHVDATCQIKIRPFSLNGGNKDE